MALNRLTEALKKMNQNQTFAISFLQSGQPVQSFGGKIRLKMVKRPRALLVNNNQESTRG